MPLKNIDEPPKPKREKSGTNRNKAKAKASEDTHPDNPWGVDDSGRRIRVTRALPYEIKLREFFVELSGAAALADSFSAKVLELKGEELAYGYAKLAKEDARVKAFFEKILQGSAWSAALMPTVSVVIMIGWHHGFIPPKLGVPMTIANGMMPVTRAQERQYKEQHRKEQAEAAQRTAAGNGADGGAHGDGGGTAD